MSGMDGARSSARRNAWQKIHFECPCGRTIYGNGKSHQRSCKRHLAEWGWPLDEGMRSALLDEGVPIRPVELALGAQTINPQYLRWVDFRDLVWRLADEVLTTGQGD